jgi:hypothetical protein
LQGVTKISRVMADFCHALTTNLTKHDRMTMDKMTTPKPLIIIVWTCQKMMALMSLELIGSFDVICWILAQKLDKWRFLSRTDHNKSDQA